MQFNRISHKLGLAGAVGACLAIGMIANQLVAERAVDAANERADRSQQVVEHILSANVNMRDSRSAYPGGQRLPLHARSVSRECFSASASPPNTAAPTSPAPPTPNAT